MASGSVPRFTALPTHHPSNPSSASQADVARTFSTSQDGTRSWRRHPIDNRRHRPICLILAFQTRPRIRLDLDALRTQSKRCPPSGFSTTTYCNNAPAPARKKREKPPSAERCSSASLSHATTFSSSAFFWLRDELRPQAAQGSASCNLSKGQCASCKAQRTRSKNERWDGYVF
jgi:hypothetical protein